MIEYTASLLTLGLLFKIGRAVYPYMGSSYLPLTNKYVVVSGCTDGIGRQYTRYFNNNYVPMVLIGRNKQKLEQLRQQLRTLNPNTQHKILKIDFSNHELDNKKYSQYINSLNLPPNSVSGFVNCCGVSFMQKFSLLSSLQIQQIKKVNINSLQFLLRILNNSIVIANPFVINLSSYTAHYPLKYNSVYSATKAYISSLLMSYSKENNSVKVLSVEPWFVKTKMAGFRNTWDSVKAEQVVQGSLRALGKRKICAGTIKHQLIYQFKFIFERFYIKSLIQEIYKRTSAHKQLRLKLQQNRKNKLKEEQNNNKSDQK